MFKLKTHERTFPHPVSPVRSSAQSKSPTLLPGGGSLYGESLNKSLQSALNLVNSHRGDNGASDSFAFFSKREAGSCGSPVYGGESPPRMEEHGGDRR